MIELSGPGGNTPTIKPASRARGLVASCAVVMIVGAARKTKNISAEAARFIACSVSGQHRQQRGNREPEQSFHQKEKKTQKTDALNPGQHSQAEIVKERAE